MNTKRVISQELIVDLTHMKDIIHNKLQTYTS